jgi:hypothetical protein
MSLRAHALSALATALLCVAGTAYAAGGPTAADRETARTLMDQGRDLRDKGDLKEALKRFQAANDIMHVPTTALEVARSQVALGLLVEARDTVAELRQIPAKKDSQLFKDARAKAEELDASLTSRVPSLTVVVTGGKPDEQTEVTIDGVAVPPAAQSLPRSVDPGHHVIDAKTATAQGEQAIDIREGEQKKVEIALVAIAVAPAPAADTTPPAEPEPPKRVHSPTTLTFVGIGVTGVGVIVGSVTGLLSIGKKSTLKSQCPNDVCGPSSYSTLNSANTLATVSDVSFAVAGAGAALAIVTLVRGHDAPQAAPAGEPATTPSEPAATAFHIEPWITGRAAGLRGTF